MAPESPSMSTCPSGGVSAPIWAATTPPAPGTFSTTKALPNAPESFCDSSRASTSGLPPGAAAAIRRTGRFGYSLSACATIPPIANARAAVAATAIRNMSAPALFRLDVGGLHQLATRGEPGPHDVAELLRRAGRHL